MEQTLLKKQKELEELRVDIGNVYQTKNDIQMQLWPKACTNGQKTAEVDGLDSKAFQLWYYLQRKWWIQEAEHFASSKTQSIVNGGKRCRSVVGCSVENYSKIYWKDL
jgi:hypothetical protein